MSYTEIIKISKFYLTKTEQLEEVRYFGTIKGCTKHEDIRKELRILPVRNKKHELRKNWPQARSVA
jgi:hypothetical protein